jgi:hypothetical protein
MKVMVYYNLHKHCLSIKALEGERRGCVVLHARAVRLKDAVFKVSQAGRARVLLERSKNVHAGVVGELVDIEPWSEGETADSAMAALVEPLGLTKQLTYDPYRFDSFVTRDTHEPVGAAPDCVVIGKRIYVPHF